MKGSSTALGHLFKSSVIYVVMGFLPLAINLLLAPLYANFVTPDEYALVGLSTLYQAFLLIFCTLGFDAGFVRLFFGVRRKQRLVDALFSTALISILGISAAFSVFTYFVYESLLKGKLFQTDAFNLFPHFIFTVFGTIASLSVNMFLSKYRNAERLPQFVKLSLTFTILNVLGTLLGIFYDASAASIILARAVLIVALAVVLLFTFFLRVGTPFSFRYFKAMWVYGMPVSLFLFINTVYTNIDRVLVERSFDLATLGHYNLAFTVASVISTLAIALRGAVMPTLFSVVSDDPTDSNRQAHFIVKATLLVILLAIYALAAVAYPLIHPLVSPGYYPMFQYLTLLLMAQSLQILFVMRSLPFLAMKRTRLMPVVSLVSLFIGYWLYKYLIDTYAILGVCYGIICIRLLQLAFNEAALAIEKLHNINWNIGPRYMFLAVFLVLVSVVLPLVWPVYPRLLDVIPLLFFLLYLGWGEHKLLRQTYEVVYTKLKQLR